MAVIGFRLYDMHRALINSVKESADFDALGVRRNARAVGRYLCGMGIASSTIATGYRIS